MRHSPFTRIWPIAIVLALGGTAGAQDARLSLPLAAPAGAHPLIKDFVEVCSQALLDPKGAGDEAERRGWADMTDDSERTEALKASGSFSLIKDLESSNPFLLTAMRSDYPHVVSSDCLMQLSFETERPEGFDTAVISRIEGVRAGRHPLAEVDRAAGLWSFLDDKGAVVTISALPLFAQILSLSMNRAERVNPPSLSQTP